MNKLIESFKDYYFKMSCKVPDGHKCYAGYYHRGHVRCVLIPDGENEIFDGPFDYQGDRKYATGNYYRDMKHGKWSFEYLGHSCTKWLSVCFNKGRVDGPLKFEVENQGMTTNTMSGMLVNIADGKVKGPVVGLLNDCFLQADFDADGQPDGHWILHMETDDMGCHHFHHELYRHGKLLESYETRSDYKSKRPVQANLYKRLAYLLTAECSPLLTLIARGTITSQLTM
jgi:hypothetical protein